MTSRLFLVNFRYTCMSHKAAYVTHLRIFVLTKNRQDWFITKPHTTQFTLVQLLWVNRTGWNLPRMCIEFKNKIYFLRLLTKIYGVQCLEHVCSKGRKSEKFLDTADNVYVPTLPNCCDSKCLQNHPATYILKTYL